MSKISEVATTASKVSAFLATILYCLTLLGQVDRVVLKHLGETFASKEDMEAVKMDVSAINHKIDVVLEGMNFDRASRKRL